MDRPSKSLFRRCAFPAVGEAGVCEYAMLRRDKPGVLAAGVRGDVGQLACGDSNVTVAGGGVAVDFLRPSAASVTPGIAK
mmetsp:Transcript_58102/g.138232  ORF Transcript_58102/g.138232 Transcript_58102/m.138232 type:complete len:80 (-) Transcript_58102:869-1108(-)